MKLFDSPGWLFILFVLNMVLFFISNYPPQAGLGFLFGMFFIRSLVAKYGYKPTEEKEKDNE